MKTKSVVLIIIGLGLFGLLGSLSSFTTHHGISQYDSEMLESNDNGWKNLKVLPQDISKDSLFALMKGYNIALGVNCNHCHSVHPKNPEKIDFADESKVEKHITRAMISMTQEINANYFNYKKDRDPAKITDVNCVMCHRGNPNPKNYLNNLGKLFPDNEE